MTYHASLHNARAVILASARNRVSAANRSAAEAEGPMIHGQHCYEPTTGQPACGQPYGHRDDVPGEQPREEHDRELDEARLVYERARLGDAWAAIMEEHSAAN